jgi:hypothetical protein
MKEHKTGDIGVIRVNDIEENKSRIKYILADSGIILSIISIIIIITFCFLINYYYSSYKLIITVLLIPIASLVAFIIKSYTSQTRKYKVLFEFIEEIHVNYANMQTNKGKVNSELDAIKRGAISLLHIDKPQLDSYNLLKQLYPEEIVSMDYSGIRSYIHNSNQIDEFIKNRIYLSMNRHLSKNGYLNAMELNDKMLLEHIEHLCVDIKSLAKSKIRSIELNRKQVKKLINKENYSNFLKLHKLNKNFVPIEALKQFYDNEVVNVIIVVLEQ